MGSSFLCKDEEKEQLLLNWLSWRFMCCACMGMSGRRLYETGWRAHAQKQLCSAVRYSCSDREWQLGSLPSGDLVPLCVSGDSRCRVLLTFLPRVSLGGVMSCLTVTTVTVLCPCFQLASYICLFQAQTIITGQSPHEQQPREVSNQCQVKRTLLGFQSATSGQLVHAISLFTKTSFQQQN